MNDTEHIVLLDESYNNIGSAPKLASHHAETPLHLAFSCYLFDSKGKLLVTRRALTKKVWPGVWTNSFCGHPAPGENIEDAIRRRAAAELGIQKLSRIQCVVPKYRYTSTPFNGIIENEFCPVYVALFNGQVAPNSEEVYGSKLVSWDDFLDDLNTNPEQYSYWTKEQVVLLDEYVRKNITK